MTARNPAVAGMFYPADETTLRSTIAGFLSAHAVLASPVPKAIIVPHAGYIYSGPIAASAYVRVAPAHDSITRVVLLGPAHRVPFRGLAATSADQFITPLGPVAIDQQAIRELLALPQVKVFDDAHALEHSLEVQLPFLQVTLDTFSCIPLVVGDATADEVAEVIERLWGGPETLIVISSDLSHYQDYETARDLDQATTRAIIAMRPEDIHYQHACGRIPVNGLLTVAHAHGMHADAIDLRNSGDTAGPRDQVVGYGAYAFASVTDPSPARRHRL
ncbi:MAG: putative dioxygenase [Gammaproteobacteria bacterium]|nr:MAG: putative dioxygenase [Gammaproteobacteria bacterium]TND06760.1 MAG: putative dioxygenase [Gammaproteobacteria bacterium]